MFYFIEARVTTGNYDYQENYGFPKGCCLIFASKMKRNLNKMAIYFVCTIQVYQLFLKVVANCIW